MVLYGCVRCSISVPWLPTSIWTACSVYCGTFGRTKIPWTGLISWRFWSGLVFCGAFS